MRTWSWWNRLGWPVRPEPRVSGDWGLRRLCLRIAQWGVVGLLALGGDVEGHSQEVGETKAPPGREPPELQTLLLEYQHRLLKARGPADEWYRMQLRGYMAQFQQAGDLAVLEWIQRELQDPDPARPPPAQIPIRIREIHSSYAVMANRYSEPVQIWLRTELDALERNLARAGRIEEARAVQAKAASFRGPSTASSTSRPSLSQPGAKPRPEWSSSSGGKVQPSATGVKLQGPGNLFPPYQIAMTFQNIELGRDFAVSGEFRIEGNAGGFALGSGEKDCVTIYWSRGTSWMVQHRGTERIILDRPAIAWSPEQWQKFQLTKKGQELEIRLDRSLATVRLPRGIGRYRFGLMTGYAPSSIEVRNLTIGALNEE